jgi:hypothetical protein
VRELGPTVEARPTAFRRDSKPMTGFLFWTFVLLLGLVLPRVLARPETIYEYPQFMAAVFGIFILPQAVSLVRFPGAAPEEAVQRVLLMTSLCLGACFVGYGCGPKIDRVQPSFREVDLSKLFHAGLVFTGCGLFFSYVLGHTEVQVSETGGWTGPATIYQFFQQLCYLGFAICLVMAIRRPGLLAIGSTFVAAIVPVQSIIFGRREPAALFALTVGLTLFFQCGLRPSRWLIAGIILAAMVAIPATATYRRYQLQRDWEAVGQINLVENFKEFIDNESVLELRNGAMLIEAARRSGKYEYGAGYWDHLMFRFVPAQIVGERVKKALMLRPSRESLESELAAMDYLNHTGSTVTGMGDSFQQFWYWGCLFFVALGAFFRSLWRASATSEAVLHQLLYVQSCTSAMRAVTHWTLDFLPGFAYSAIFLGLAAWYASVRTRHPDNTRKPRQISNRALCKAGLQHTTRGPAPPPSYRSRPYLPSAFATMKINTAPPNPPPRRRYKSE